MIPNLLFKEPIPDDLPKGMRKVIKSLRRCKSKEKCLEKAYRILTRRYHGENFRTYTRFYELLFWDVYYLWDRTGFLHAPQINYLMRILLVKSGHFDDDDIQLKLAMYYGLPHQYLLVYVGGRRFMNIDPWSHALGVKFGDYLHGFA
jgi:hypothetical protein